MIHSEINWQKYEVFKSQSLYTNLKFYLGKSCFKSFNAGDEIFDNEKNSKCSLEVLVLNTLQSLPDLISFEIRNFKVLNQHSRNKSSYMNLLYNVKSS